MRRGWKGVGVPEGLVGGDGGNGGREVESLKKGAIGGVEEK